MRRLRTIGVLFLSVPLLCFARQSSNSSSNSSSGQQTASSAPADAATGTKQTSQTTDDNKKKPKKVWTDDEIVNVKGDVSVVGDPSSGGGSRCPSASRGGCTPAASNNAPASAYDKMVQGYLRQLAPLRSQVADFDRKIQKAKEAKGNATEDTRAYIQVYTDRRADVMAKIDAILEEAREHSVLPGDLR